MSKTSCALLLCMSLLSGCAATLMEHPVTKEQILCEPRRHPLTPSTSMIRNAGDALFFPLYVVAFTVALPLTLPVLILAAKQDKQPCIDDAKAHGFVEKGGRPQPGRGRRPGSDREGREETARIS